MPRTWVSDVPLAITKQSVTSETPRMSRTTTFCAFMSRARVAARWASWRDWAVAEEGMRRGTGSRTDARPLDGTRGFPGKAPKAASVG